VAFGKLGVTEYSITLRFIAIAEEQTRKALGDSTCSLLTTKPAPPASSGAGSPVAAEIPLEHHGPAWARARTVVEKDSPIWFRVLDRESEAKLLKLVDSDRRSKVLDAPRITTFSGQTASVSDIAHTPFVVGETVLPSGKREPTTRDVIEGTTLHLRPVAASHRDLGLSFSASFSRMEQVTGEHLKIAPDRERVLQIPHVSTLCIEGSVSLKPGQSLLLGGAKGFAEATEVSSTDKLLGGRLLPKQRAVQPLELIVLVRVEAFRLPSP